MAVTDDQIRSGGGAAEDGPPNVSSSLGVCFEGVWAEIGCSCSSSNSETIAFHRRSLLPRCLNHRRLMVCVEHSRLVRVDIEICRSTSGWSRLLCVRRFGGARSGFYLVAVTSLNPHSRAAFCYIISALAHQYHREAFFVSRSLRNLLVLLRAFSITIRETPRLTDHVVAR